MKGFKDKNKKFHPINNQKGVRKSRDQKAKTQGVKIRKAKDSSVATMFLFNENEDKMFSSRLKEAKRQNQGYEQLMDSLHEHILKARRNKENTEFYEKWLRKVIQAERIRPDKSFDYHWVTREVEDRIEDHPDVTTKQLKQMIFDLDVGVTNKQIEDGIKQLKEDSVIKSGKHGFIINEDTVDTVRKARVEVGEKLNDIQKRIIAEKLTDLEIIVRDADRSQREKMNMGARVSPEEKELLKTLRSSKNIINQLVATLPEKDAKPIFNKVDREVKEAFE